MNLRASFLPTGLGLLALLMGLTEAPAQFRPPPQGKPLTVEVPRGGTVTIPLTGSDRALRDLQFSIGRSPRWGRLSGISVESRGRASVRYTHGDDEDSLSDSFVYTVKAGSGGTGRATINIKVVDAAPVLAAPRVVDFGEVVLGETPIQSLQVANLGGGMLEGEIKVPEPFAVETDGSFRLRRGRSADFAISFAPTAPGDFLHRASLSPQDPSVVEFRGRALEPFEVGVDSSVLAAQPDDSRRASLRLVNHAATNNVILITLPPDSLVKAPREVSLAPGETAPLELSIEAQTKGDVPPFPVVFSTASHTNTRTFSAPPVPARVAIVAAPDFGEVKPGFNYEAELSVRNDGGALAPLRLRPGPEIRSTENTEAFDLASGETKTIKLKLRVKKDQTGPESLPTNLLIDFNGTQIAVPVRATMGETPAAEVAKSVAPEVLPPPAPPAATPPPLALNTDITLRRTNDVVRLEWVERTGWTDYGLQRRDDVTGQWAAYEPPPPPRGIVAWALALPARLSHFFSTPIKREEVPAMQPEEEAQGGATIPASDAASPAVWRLQAVPFGTTGRATVSAEFTMTGDSLAVAPAPEEVEPGLRPPNEEGIVAAARDIQIAWSDIKTDRHTAAVVIGLPRNEAINAYRLERGALAIPSGSGTNPVGQPRFTPIEHASDGTKVVGLARVKVGDRDLDVISAQIEDLPAGSRTYWRLVTDGEATNARTTGLFAVNTKPAPPFPWNTMLLGLLLALFAGVLYLRWRINHPPE